MYSQLTYSVSDPIATITLNRPESLNAWTFRMGVELKHAIAAAESDKRVVVIVLTGAGRGFCSGADLNDLKSISEGKTDTSVPPELEANPGDPSWGEDFRGTYTYLLSVRKPIVCAINGPAAGMAVPIALACDIRFASDRAIITTAFSRRGLIAEWGIAWLLNHVVGPAHALDLLYSARKVDAKEAERIGLVNRVLPHDDLMGFVNDYATDLATNCSPTSMMIMKRQVYQQLTAALGPSEKEAVQLMLESFVRPDFREGVMSFLQKRPPKFERI